MIIHAATPTPSRNPSCLLRQVGPIRYTETTKTTAATAQHASMNGMGFGPGCQAEFPAANIVRGKTPKHKKASGPNTAARQLNQNKAASGAKNHSEATIAKSRSCSTQISSLRCKLDWQLWYHEAGR